MENGNPNINVNADLQPPEERANDTGRDVKRKGTAKRKDEAKVNTRRKIISALLIVLLLFGSMGSFDAAVYGNQLGQAKKTPKTIYETLEVDDLYDLVEIKGDEKKGYYYDFIDGTEVKLDQLVKKLQKDGNKAITKDLLKKMIKAEVVNQFPFLQGTGSGSSLTSGNTVAEKVWNFMIENGYTEEATAGLMGNIHQESGGFNPAIVENGGSGEGIGLCQWSYGRRTRLENFARERGKDWTDVDIQLEYLLWELQNDGFNGNVTYQSQWENATTPEEAAVAFEYGFERAGTPMMENRTHWARVYYEQFRGTYTASSNSGQSISLDGLSGILFIGDSITNGLGQSGYITDEGVIFKGVDNSTPEQWNNNTNANFGQPTYSTLPNDRDSIKALCVMIGTNNPRQISDTKSLLKKLHNKYPEKIIFVQKLLPNTIAGLQVDIFNTAIESYCSENSDYFKFIDSTEGVAIGSDGTHPTSQGYKTLAENTRKSIANAIGGVSIETFLEEAQKVADYVRENHFTYGDAPINPAINHDAKLVSCDRFVGWVLYNVGYTDQPEQQGLTAHVLRDYCIEKGWQEVTSVSALQAGDIVFTNNNGDSYGHTFICAGKGASDNTYLRYDCGSQSRIDSQQPFDEPINGFTKAFRPNLSELNSNYLGEFSGTIRIRRVTPNKNIGEVKNTGSGVITDTTSNISSSAAGKQIEDYIQSNATSGTWSVYAKNLTSNSVKVSINNQKLKSASLIKLFIMATAFEEIEKGTLKENEVIDDIRIMINKSDNDATNRLIDKLGFNKINNYIETNGYNATEIHRKMLENPTEGDNYTSVMDVGNLLEKMYRGTCVNQSASQEMIEILKTQTLKEKIPAGVPAGVETANKTGELDDVENDAAIVYKDGAHYILVVMSNGISNKAAAQNNIKEISSKVYETINTSSSSQGGTNSNASHKVAIVAGHGVPENAGTYEQIANRTKWYTTGTSGKTPSGETWKEWQITKKVADYVEKYLYPYSSQVSVVQVGYSQANWERMQLAKEQGVDSYVGIHFNSSENTSASRSKCLLS